MMDAEVQLPGFYNNFVNGGFSSTKDLGVMEVGDNFFLHECKVRDVHFIIREEALIQFIRCEFDNCDFSVGGKLNQGSCAINNIFNKCKTGELQIGLTGYCIGGE